MVFVHGDSYEFGSGNAYDPSILVSYGKIITVTLNFRLGIFGFLGTANYESSGNLALLDIRDALLWIRSNIAQFGGDPNNISLMGHSYGAALVNLFLASKLSQSDLGIRNALLLSGSALAPWAVSPVSRSFNAQLAAQLNFTQDTVQQSKYFYEVLRRTSVKRLLQAISAMPTLDYQSRLGPTLNSIFFTRPTVMDNLNHRDNGFNSIRLLVGINRDDGYTYLNSRVTSMKNNTNNLEWRRSLRDFVRQNYLYHQQKIFDILNIYYTDSNSINIDRHKAACCQEKVAQYLSLLQLTSDAMFMAPSIKTAKLHAQFNKKATYFYLFDYKSPLPDYPSWASGIHGEDLMYIFGAPMLSKTVEELSPFPNKFLKTERMLSEAIMKYISNFIKSGNPNTPEKQTSNFGGHITNRYKYTIWPAFTLQNEKYLHFSKQMENPISCNYRSRFEMLWNRLLPRVHSNEDNFTMSENQRLTKNFTLEQEIILPKWTHKESDATTLTTILMNWTSISPHNQRSKKETKPNVIFDIERSLNQLVTIRSLNAIESIYLEQRHVIVSIVIGACAVLLFNFIIFFAIYYQVVKLRKLRQSAADLNTDFEHGNSELVSKASREIKVNVSSNFSKNGYSNLSSDEPSTVLQNKNVTFTSNFKSKSYEVDFTSSTNSPQQVTTNMVSYCHNYVPLQRKKIYFEKNVVSRL